MADTVIKSNGIILRIIIADEIKCKDDGFVIKITLNGTIISHSNPLYLIFHFCHK